MSEKRGSSASQIRLIVVIVIGLAAIILAFQNREPVSTKFLMFETTMPRIALILLTAVFGFLAGYLARGSRRRQG